MLGQHGGSMVWSPLSNLLLYGATARVDAAKRAGVRIGLGSDWSPSGSKNLLGELKVAWLYSQHLLDGLFSARDLVAMATRDAAAILKWHKALGTLEPGKRADLLVIAGKTGDPYEALIKAKETAIRLVMINGVARYGMPSLMVALGAKGQTVRVGGVTRRLFLEQQSADPDVANVSLSAARSALTKAFRDLPKLARELEKPKPKQAPRALDAPQPVVWSLALDEIQAYRGRPAPAAAVRRAARLHRARSLRRASVGTAVDDSSAHHAGSAHRGRRSELSAQHRRAAQRAGSDPHWTGQAVLTNCPRRRLDSRWGSRPIDISVPKCSSDLPVALGVCACSLRLNRGRRAGQVPGNLIGRANTRLRP